MNKSQITDFKKQTNHNTQIQNLKQLKASPPFGYWDLEFVWNLVLGICYFRLVRLRRVCRDGIQSRNWII